MFTIEELESRKKARLKFLYGIEDGAETSNSLEKAEPVRQSHHQPVSESENERWKSIWSLVSQISVPGVILAADKTSPSNSHLQVLTNFIRGNIGVGVLSMCHAFKQAGIITGAITILFYGFLNGYCCNVILTSYDKLVQGNRKIGLGKLAKIAFEKSKLKFLNRFGKVMELLINFFILLTQIGTISVLLLFISRTIHIQTEIYFHEYFNVSSSHFIFISSILLLPLIFLKSLKIMAILSTLSNLVNMFCLIVIFQYLLRNIQPFENVTWFGDVHGFFILVGTALFSFHSVQLILPLRAGMKHPEDLGGFSGILGLGNTLITVINISTGFFGYLATGEDAMVVIFNLPNTFLYDSVRILWAICVYLCINIQFYVIISILLPFIQRKMGKSYVWEFFLRLIIFLLCFALAFFVPCLEQLIALVGSIAAAFFCLCTPPLLAMVSQNISLNPNDKKTLETIEEKEPLKYEDKDNNSKPFLLFGFIWNFCVIIFGFVVAFAGTFVAIEELSSVLEWRENCL